MKNGHRTARFAKAGFLFVALAVTVVAAASPAAKAQTYKPMHAFRLPMGANPAAGLLQDASGNLYGTTNNGGTHGYGTVFELTANGQFTVLYNFKGQGDGAYPTSNLILGTDGNFYGTTPYGGDMQCTPNAYVVGCGVVFRVTPSGQETPLYAFKGYPSDGAEPSGGLVVNPTTGIAYGVTSTGGMFADGGTVYSINLSTGQETVLTTFTTGGESQAIGPLIMDSVGNLYGTVSLTEDGDEPVGEIFKLTPTGEQTSLFQFYGLNGKYPAGTLAMDAAGNIYGSATEGGIVDLGTVYELTPTGQFTILHNFSGRGDDGIGPLGGVTLGSNGILYGTSGGGGRYEDGTVFQITLSTGTYSTIYSFRGYTDPIPDGQRPYAPVVLGPAGTLYGATLEGADPACTSNGTIIGCGTIFEIVP